MTSTTPGTPCRAWPNARTARIDLHRQLIGKLNEEPAVAEARRDGETSELTSKAS